MCCGLSVCRAEVLNLLFFPEMQEGKEKEKREKTDKGEGGEVKVAKKG